MSIFISPEAIAGFVMCLILAIGLSLSYGQLRLMKKTAQAELIKNMSEYWDSQMIESREALGKIENGEALFKAIKRCEEEKDIRKWLTLTRVGSFFELMGNLARRKAIDTDIIAGKFRTEIIGDYKLYKPFIEKKRTAQTEPQPTVYEHFEWLAKKMQKVKTKVKRN